MADDRSFDKFTERARRVVSLAQTEAKEMRHETVGTEHLLLALAAEGEGVASKVLQNLGVTADDLRSRVAGGRPPSPTVVDEPEFTEAALDAIKAARREAARLGHYYVGTEHLLLAVAEPKAGQSVRVLSGLKVSPTQIKHECERILAPVLRPRNDPLEAIWNTSLAYSDLRRLMALTHDSRSESRAPMEVDPIFRTRSFVVDEKRCFVLMPFDPKFRPIFDDHLAPAIGRVGLNPKRADDVFSPGQVMEQIWSEINIAGIVMADLTDKNANVFYELGIAHTLGKPVIILTQRSKDAPFDLRHLRYIEYGATPRGCKKLESDVELALRAVAATRT